MSGRKTRTLSAEEKQLWSRVTETAIPMPQTAAKRAEPDQIISKRKPVASYRSDGFELGQRAAKQRDSVVLIPSVADHLRHAPLQMDQKAFARMKRGKLTPEARLDLHGMTLDQAHPRLNRFVLDAYASGKRLVLVITGKGKSKYDAGPIPVRLGVLKHQVPQWLQQAPLRQAVLQVTPANQRHGGGGAYYVYLRKAR